MYFFGILSVDPHLAARTLFSASVRCSFTVARILFLSPQHTCSSGQCRQEVDRTHLFDRAIEQLVVRSPHSAKVRSHLHLAHLRLAQRGHQRLMRWKDVHHCCATDCTQGADGDRMGIENYHLDTFHLLHAWRLWPSDGRRETKQHFNEQHKGEEYMVKCTTHNTDVFTTRKNHTALHYQQEQFQNAVQEHQRGSFWTSRNFSCSCFESYISANDFQIQENNVWGYFPSSTARIIFRNYFGVSSGTRSSATLSGSRSCSREDAERRSQCRCALLV